MNQPDQQTKLTNEPISQLTNQTISLVTTYTFCLLFCNSTIIILSVSLILPLYLVSWRYTLNTKGLLIGRETDSESFKCKLENT